MLSHSPWRIRVSDHGASITEYAALLVIVGVIATVIAASPIGRVISDHISHSICTAMGGDDCDSPAEEPVADDEAPAPADEDSTEHPQDQDTEADADEDPQPPASADSPDSSDPHSAQPAVWEGSEEVLDTQPVLWSTDNLLPFGDDEDEEQQSGPELSPDPDASPEDVSDWWDELSESERQEVIQEEGEHIRNRDGIPAEVRDELNREHLDDEITEMLEDEEFTREEVLNAERDDMESWFSFGDPSEELYELVELEQELNSSDELFDHHLLALDTDNDRAIVATGNPDTADHVSTVVPGAATEWQDVNQHRGRAERLHMAAEAEGAEGEEHASIAWLGYDAPSMLGAVSSNPAEEATPALQEFQQGLEATHETGTSTNSLVGHSYGSVVVGHAARESELDADQLLLVASPGVGGELDELDFNGDIEDIHVLESDDDWVSGSEWVTQHSYDDLEHGQESRYDFAPDDEVGHSGYFDDVEDDWMRYMGGVIASD